MHPGIQWLKDHWFLITAGVGMVSVQAVALDDIRDLQKVQEAQQRDNQQIQQNAETLQGLDERSKIMLDAVQQIQQEMMRRSGRGTPQ